MSTVNSERTFSHLFLNFGCPCGVELRVKRELAGTEVRCWSCHAMVMVPFPQTTGQVVRSLVEGVRRSVAPKSLLVVSLAAAVVTGALGVSRDGVPLACIVLILAGFGYGEWIRGEAPRNPAGTAGGARPLRLALRAVAAVAPGLAVAATVWSASKGFGQPLRLAPAGVALAVLAMAALPLLIFAAYGRDDSGPLPLRRVGALLAGHPWVALAAILIVPAGVLLTEAMLFVLTSLTGWLQFLLLELYPRPAAFCSALGIPYYADYTSGELPDARFLRMYSWRLQQGYSLLGAIPPSLSVPKVIATNPWTLDLTREGYLTLRIALTQLIVTILMLAAGIQARWLGRLPALDPRRPSR